VDLISTNKKPIKVVQLVIPFIQLKTAVSYDDFMSGMRLNPTVLKPTAGIFYEPITVMMMIIRT
jgi:hypothetical protein